jgi:hypothetical protein
MCGAKTLTSAPNRSNLFDVQIVCTEGMSMAKQKAAKKSEPDVEEATAEELDSATEIDEAEPEYDPRPDHPVRRRTTRTVRREGETYTTETNEVVEDFDAPPLLERTPGEHPLPVG